MPTKHLFANCLLTGILVFFSSLSFAQTTPLTGKVVDDKGNPLPGATVTVKGTNVSVSADSIGRFRINAPTSARTLLISSIGFADKEIAISRTTPHNEA